MKITALKNVLVKGSPVAAGETIDIEANLAQELINMGRCKVAAKEDPKEKPKKKAKSDSSPDS